MDWVNIQRVWGSLDGHVSHAHLLLLQILDPPKMDYYTVPRISQLYSRAVKAEKLGKRLTDGIECQPFQRVSA